MKFEDLVNIDQLTSLFNNYTAATGVVVAILEYPSQKILIATGWKDLCTKFHRVCPESAKLCYESDFYLSSCLKNKNDLSISYCKNGLVDGCAPIIVEGEHLATIFAGQVLFEKPDVDKFIDQAKKYGFDQKAYLKALEEIPVITKDQFISNLKYFAELALVFAEIGLANKNIIKRENDINEQYKLLQEKEEELAQTQALLSATFDKSPAAIIIFNKNLSPSYFNEQVAELFGQDKESLLNFSYNNPGLNFKLLTSDRIEYEFNKLPIVLAAKNKIESKNIEAIVKRQDGSERWILVNAAPVLDNDGNVLQVICVFLDITQRKILENELLNQQQNLETKVAVRTSELQLSLVRLEKANQYKNQFLTSMSHELRTPLNAILGFNQVLQKQYFGKLNDKQAEYINLVGQSSEHLLSLINDLLDLAKIDSGTLELLREPFLPEDLIAEIIKLMITQYRDKKIELISKINLQNNIIEADKRKCKQVLFNLLSNAHKFTPKGGRVELEVEVMPDKNEIIFSVIDNGIGIRKGDENKIFSEFFQSQQLDNLAIHGTGIGLALSKKLVEMHGGSIGAKNNLKKGSTFWFTLPLFSKKLCCIQKENI